MHRTIPLDFHAAVKPGGRRVRRTAAADHLFGVDGLWLKGESHAHPKGWEEDAQDLYRTLGYDFLVRDDSMIREDGDDLMIIPGYEIKLCLPGGFLAHLVTIGLADGPVMVAEDDDGGEEESPVARVETMIRRVHAHNGLALLAHPLYSGWRMADMQRLHAAGLDGVEVVNGACLRDKGNCGRADQLWRLLMRDGRPLMATGGGDPKGGSRFRAGRAWTGVLATERSGDAVVEAFRRGRTYASEGPEFRGVTLDPDGRLTVQCTPCAACHLLPARGGFKAASAVQADQKLAGDVFVFELSQLVWQQHPSCAGRRIGEALVVVLEDAGGRQAWLSPLSLDMTVHDDR